MRVFFFLLLSLSIGVCSDLKLNATQQRFSPTSTTEVKKTNPVSAIFYQSIDGGKTWQDISTTLPEGIDIQHIYAFKDAYYLISNKGDLYQTTDPLKGSWQRETVLTFNNIGTNKGEGIWNIFELKSGIYATIYEKGFYKKMGNNVWIPLHENLAEKVINSIVETADGSIAVSTPTGIYKTNDTGKTWQQVLKQPWIASLCQNQNTMIACSPDGLIRSTDNGTTWETVLTDKGVFFSTSIVEGKFTAIRQFDPNKDKERFFKPKCSYFSPDSGKTWQCIDQVLSPIEGLYDFKKIDNDYYCGHKSGIYRSKDKGINWELVLPIQENKDNFRLEVIPSQNTIFIAKVWAGC